MKIQNNLQPGSRNHEANRKTNRLLICDDDALYHLKIKRSLSHQFSCISAYDSDETLSIIKNQDVDLLLLDIRMRTEEEGLQCIPKFLKADPELSIIINSAVKHVHSVQKAMRLGAIDYLIKDCDSDDLVHTLTQALERRSLLKRHQQQTFEALSLHCQQHTLIGESPAIKTLRKTIEKVRNSSANSIIYGETGTGKEVVARQLRRTQSDQSLAPFIAVDSGTIQSNMAESLLFGHERGSFTGADKTTKGMFEEANGGIVYFDEISNMPLSIQAKLLRVLQEKEVVRLGSSKPIKLQFRVICATNKNLEEMIDHDEFKGDLFQRLNVIPIHVPPLRERTEDIPLLIDHFCRKYFHGANPLKFSIEAIGQLQRYSWPGNIRELSNWIEYLATMSEESEIGVSDVLSRFNISSPSMDARKQNLLISKSEQQDQGFYERVAAFESSLLAEEFIKYKRCVGKLAKAFKMDRSHLYTKLKEYGIYRPRNS